MAESILRSTTLSVLLLASISQGLRDVEVFHDETVEAAAGQNITLPCLIRTNSSLHIVQTEWKRKDTVPRMLAVYAPGYGVSVYDRMASLEIVDGDEGSWMGTYLWLLGVNGLHSGAYVCEIAAFPLGSIMLVTEVKVKDPEIVCNTNSTLEVNIWENVTLHCTALYGTRYRWTKDENVLSDNETLELQGVTEDDGGLYKLSVSIGNQTYQRELSIKVLNAATSTERGSVTHLPQLNVTDAVRNKTAALGGLTPATASTAQRSPTPRTTTTMFSLLTAEPQDTGPNISPNTSVSTEEEPGPSGPSTTRSYNSSTFGSTEEMTQNVSWVSTSNPDNISSSTFITVRRTSEPAGVTATTTLNDTQRILGGNVEIKGDTDVQRPALMALIVIPVLAFAVLVKVVHTRHTERYRMDQPPPFKPPPPPVKYASVRTSEPLTASGCHHDRHII